jgi:hypothetical protein
MASNQRTVLYASRIYDRHTFSNFTFIAPRHHDRDYWQHSEMNESLRMHDALRAQFELEEHCFLTQANHDCCYCDRALHCEWRDVSVRPIEPLRLRSEDD